MASRLDDTEALEALATAQYAGGEFEGSLASWERIHAVHVERGENVEAARAGAMVAMFLMMDSGLMAPVRGWLRRVERLLVDGPETPVHAMVAMIRGYERFMCGDWPMARTWASRAIELGERHGVVPAVMLGRVATARMMIFDGEVDEGLAELEDIAVTLLSETVDPLTTGIMFCELVCAAQGMGQHDRAEEWTQVMDTLRQRGEFVGALSGRCRVHRAEVLRLRGDFDEAEEEALRACEELRPWMRREYGWPLAELGTIRLRRGDLAGAEEAFVASHANGWDPQPGLALLRLRQGQTEVAVALIRDAIERPTNIPSKERPPVQALTRAPLLEAQVEIALAGGDEETARQAADELRGIAEQYQSLLLRAAASLARGRVEVFAKDHAAAVGPCREAVAAYCSVGAPHEASVARHVLADALEGVGEVELAGAERLAAGAGQGAFTTHGSTDLGGPAPTTAQESVFRCDGDTRTITYAGLTVLVHDLTGLRHLARLLAEPAREFHALDLVAVEHGTLPTTGGGAVGDGEVTAEADLGPLLDDEARQAYRRRLVEVESEIEDATAMGDSHRAELARADKDFLVAELSRAFGLGGRQRQAGSSSERARTTVTRSVRYAMARIAEHHPALAEHLAATIRTGTYFAYEPDPRVPIHWAT